MSGAPPFLTRPFYDAKTTSPDDILPDVQRLLIAALVATAFGVGTPRGQGPAAPAPMSLVALAGIPRLLDPQLSPDGQSVLYTLTHADWQANRGLGQVWRRDWLKYLEQRSLDLSILHLSAASRLRPSSLDSWLLLVPLL